ncbi:nicotinate-nucleotide adenylyltransferase [Paenibacillus sp. JSM ZJ436]|uniref:nicotinate-nucleotide adenylyltransferase n=1 Tax=Paenibacillus sp. JSM ZJ436 TaxID=3376190 RepID=UPI0037B1F64F
MKAGIMGGTFDPIHMGHLMAAESAREAYGLDEVWFMPSHTPPHKVLAGVTAEMRYEMTCLAISSHPDFKALDLEIRREGVSYTIDTISALKQQQPDSELYFIIGADMVNYLPKWHRIEELSGLLSFIGVNRPGSRLELDLLPEFLSQRVHLCDMPMMDISSTVIRERMAAGKSIRYMVPEPVYDYITRSGIYRV